MTTGDRFVSIQAKRIMGFLDFRDRFLDFTRQQYSDLVEQIFGDDGTFGSPITLSEFGLGVDRFQLDSTALRGSDGFGHLIQPDAELAGQDVGFQFENANTVEYFVAQHFATRPRGIQINPRTGFPEFLEFEETTGDRAEPTSVTDNGGTITFNVNSVARLFSPDDNSLDQTGRQVLVWKKTPGKTAITEGQAIEQLTISLNGGNNEVTTTGTLGQSTVSTNASDYFVLLLGASVSERDLSAENEYHFIGKITGAGTGNTPAFDLTGQNILGPIAADINVISEVHHGNRKLRTLADNSDVDETQLQIQGRPDAGFPIQFSVDEDGDTRIEGTVGIRGVPVTTHNLRVYGTALPSEIEGILQLGDLLTAAGGDVASGTARLQYGAGMDVEDYYLISEAETTTGPSRYVRTYRGLGDKFVVTYNCFYTNTTGLWAKDQAGLDAVKMELQMGLGFNVYLRLAASAGTWDDLAQPSATTGWDSWNQIGSTVTGMIHTGGMFADTMGLGSNLFDTANGAVDADAEVARLEAPPTNTTADFTRSLLLISEEAPGASFPRGHARMYAMHSGGFMFTMNAEYDEALDTWSKDNSGQAACSLEISGGQIVARFKERDENTPWVGNSGWIDGGGGGTFSLAGGFTPVGQRPDMTWNLNIGNLRWNAAVTNSMLNNSTYTIDNGNFRVNETIEAGDENPTAARNAAVALAHKVDARYSNDTTVGLIGINGEGGSSFEGVSSYFDSNGFEVLFNARRNPAAETRYLRMTNTLPSYRLFFDRNDPGQDDSDRARVQLYVRGGTESDDWFAANWRLLQTWSLGDTGFTPTSERNGVILRDGRIIFQNGGPVTAPADTTASPDGLDWQPGYVALGKNQTHCWARISVTAGAAPVLESGFNVSSIGNAGTSVRINTHPDWGSNARGLIITNIGTGETPANVTYEVNAEGPTSVDIRAVRDGVVLDMTDAGTNVEFMVAMTGTLNI